MSNRIPDISAEYQKIIERIISQAPKQVVNVVRPRTPVRTGHLRRSWKSRNSQFSFIIRNTAAYAEYVESGTSRMAARPNLYPLLPTILDELNRAIKTGTDFSLPGGAYSDPVDDLKSAYKQKYGSYGSHKGFSV